MEFNSGFKGLIDCFNIVTLASSYSALPEDGNYTATCCSFIVISCTLFQSLLQHFPKDGFKGDRNM